MKRFAFVIMAVALAATGCGGDDGGGGAGTGGDDGGAGGDGGTGGGIPPAGETTTYSQFCFLDLGIGDPQEVTVESTITVDWSGVSGEDATTSVTVTAINALLAGVAGSATLTSLEQITDVSADPGVTPTEITNEESADDTGKTLDNFLVGGDIVFVLDDSTDAITPIEGATTVEFAYNSLVMELSALSMDFQIDTAEDCEAAAGNPIVIDVVQQ